MRYFYFSAAWCVGFHFVLRIAPHWTQRTVVRSDDRVGVFSRVHPIFHAVTSTIFRNFNLFSFCSHLNVALRRSQCVSIDDYQVWTVLVAAERMCHSGGTEACRAKKGGRGSIDISISSVKNSILFFIRHFRWRNFRFGNGQRAMREMGKKRMIPCSVERVIEDVSAQRTPMHWRYQSVNLNKVQANKHVRMEGWIRDDGIPFFVLTRIRRSHRFIRIFSLSLALSLCLARKHCALWSD